MTDASALPAEIQTFIRERVHSIEQLEVLLLLRGERERSWAAGELAAALRIAPDVARSALEELAQAGIASISSGAVMAFRYGPRDAALDQLVEQLSASYTTHRVEVLVLISSNAMHRVRNSALRTFSEAFRLRGRKKDG